jgi:hypothetical protein
MLYVIKSTGNNKYYLDYETWLALQATGEAQVLGLATHYQAWVELEQATHFKTEFRANQTAHILAQIAGPPGAVLNVVPLTVKEEEEEPG